MSNSFLEAIERRRSYYAIKNESPVSDDAILDIVRHVVKHTPSSFNSQSTRVVVLLGETHKKAWNLTKEELRKVVPAEAFEATEQKIDNCFAAGYGTILFYEDQRVVKALQEQFPLYAENFPVWSEQTNAMHQFNIWTALEEVGFGASLQHYNPLVDKAFEAAFGINENWLLRGQMPFGVPVGEPDEKQFQPLDERVLVCR